MKNIKQSLTIAFVALALGVQAQTPAKELVQNNPITQLERGQSVDVFTGYGTPYSVVGSTFGYSNGTPVPGAVMLFENNTHVRNYSINIGTGSAGVGRRGTIGIDLHALVVGASEWKNDAAQEMGIVAVAKKSWNGTDYEPNFSQYLFSGTNTSDGFGGALSISNSWLAVGASKLNDDEGGVKIFARNNSTGVWEDKGWLTLPNFNSAPFRVNDYGSINKARFGTSVSINNNNLIVGAPGVGSFYIYEFTNNAWKLVSEYKGTKQIGHRVAISDEYAVATDGGINTEVYKKTWGTNPWNALQTITTNAPITDVATQGQKLVLGQTFGGSTGQGQVMFYEITSHPVAPGSYVWVNDFVKKGRMNVSIAASTNGLLAHNLLGHSVAMHNTTVIAGAPNARYTGFADGAGFLADFSQMIVEANQNVYARKGEVQEEELAFSSLFPNPASEVVNIASTGDVLSVVATSTFGEVFNLEVSGKQANTSVLKSGLYVIKVTTTESETSQKLLIK